MSGASRYYRPGSWNACCDQCGELFKSSDMVRQWDGFYVDRRCLDLRNAQELIRMPRAEQAIPWTRNCGNGCTCSACQAKTRDLNSHSSDRVSSG